MTIEDFPTREAAEHSLLGWRRTGPDDFAHANLRASIEKAGELVRVAFKMQDELSQVMMDSMAAAEARAWDKRRG